MISLVDEVRQWFKSKVGLDQQQRLVRSRSVRMDSPERTLHRPDARKGPAVCRQLRWSRANLISGFTRAFPWSTRKDWRLGTLCVVDHQPRPAFGRAAEGATGPVAAGHGAAGVKAGFNPPGGCARTRQKFARGCCPFCAWCKRIRDDKGITGSGGAYIHKSTGADFTHGICRSAWRSCVPKSGTNHPPPKAAQSGA